VRPRVVVTRAIPEQAIDLLRAVADVWVSPHDRALSPAELHEAIAGANGIVALLHDTIDDAFLAAAGPQLAIVANVAAGYDNVDVAACERHGVTFTNTPGVLTNATADIAISLILMVTRRLAEGERLIRSQEPWAWNMAFLLGTEIAGKTLGIVGLGQIGRATARRARAFGMEIVYSGRRRSEASIELELDAQYVSFDELLETADVVSLHCPLTDETRHLIDAARLAQMKRSAYLINTTRGPVVDEEALATALRDGVIAGAGLDVFEREPLVHEALIPLDNVVMVPHMGSATVETRTAMATLAARNVVEVLAGRPALTAVTSSRRPS
jgi:glyoxylate reductase